MRVCIALFIFQLFLLFPCLGSGADRPDAAIPSFRADNIFQSGQFCPRVHSPTITILPDQSLLTAFWCATGEGALDGRIVLSRLDRGTDIWTSPETIADTTERFDGNPVLFTYPDGRVWFLFSVRDPDAPGMVQVVTRASGDGGMTWSPQEPFQTQRGVRTRNHPIMMDNGEVLLPLHDHMTGESLILISADAGESWMTSSRLVCGQACIQPSVITRADGSLYTLMRSWNEKPFKRYLFHSESRDHGRTWSHPTYSRIRSVSSAVEMITLASGRVVLVYNDGVGRERTRLNITLSEDGGRSWVWTRNLDSGKGPYSYPSLAQSDDGVIHLVYTYERRTIRHVQLNEAWVMSGD